MPPSVLPILRMRPWVATATAVLIERDHANGLVVALRVACVRCAPGAVRNHERALSANLTPPLHRERLCIKHERVLHVARGHRGERLAALSAVPPPTPRG